MIRKFLILIFLTIGGLAFANPPGTYQPLLLTGGAGIDCTGGTITHSGAYTIHTITASTNLVCTQDKIIDFELMAAGGAGNTDRGGGGGSGSVCPYSNVSILAGTYPVVIGNGVVQSNGQDSTFNSITAKGGGFAGGGVISVNGQAGGSGGGSRGNGGASGATGGAATAVSPCLGFAGGNNPAFIQGAPSGGTPTSVGTNSSSVNGANSPNGYTSLIDGIMRACGGPGGAAVGGTGGTSPCPSGATGGNPSSAGTAAGNNTASGGGGDGDSNSSSANIGGSGILLVRYAR